KTDDGHKVAFKIATSNAEARRQIGIRPDPAIELERWYDLRPIRPVVFAEFGERIGDADGGDKAEVDRDLGQLGALIAHGQDWAAKGAKQCCKPRIKSRVRIGAANDIALRLHGAFHGAAEYERFNLIIEAVMT